MGRRHMPARLCPIMTFAAFIVDAENQNDLEDAVFPFILNLATFAILLTATLKALSWEL